MKVNSAEIMLWVVTIAAIIMTYRVNPRYSIGLAIVLAVFYALKSLKSRR